MEWAQEWTIKNGKDVKERYFDLFISHNIVVAVFLR
jgi:hypothetical protein